jgi:hypothetical protein
MGKISVLDRLVHEHHKHQSRPATGHNLDSVSSTSDSHTSAPQHSVQQQRGLALQIAFPTKLCRQLVAPSLHLGVHTIEFTALKILGDIYRFEWFTCQFLTFDKI